MQGFRSFIVRTATSTPLLLLLALALGLNIYWGITLNAFDAHFVEVSGFRLLDLEYQAGFIEGSLLTPEAALQQVQAYTGEARALYWSFFILDNLLPPLVFGVFAFIWAALLNITPSRVSLRLLHSPLILLPFGVGFFDWWENLAFIAAIYAPGDALAALTIGTVLNGIKALFVVPLFPLTLLLILYALLRWTRRDRSTATTAATA